MTVAAVQPNAGGGSTANNASYSSTLNGSGLSVLPGTGDSLVGQGFSSGSGYFVYQQNAVYPYTANADQLIPSAYFEYLAAQLSTSPVALTLEIRSYTSDSTWRTTAQITASSLLARVVNAHTSPLALMRGGSTDLVTRLGTTGSLNMSLTTDRTRTATTPTTGEVVRPRGYASFATFPDPNLVYTSMPLSTLNRVLGAQIQLSDGTHVYLESTASLTAPTITVCHRDLAGSVTTIATLPTGTGASDFFVGVTSGAQTLALARDAANNLYVIGRQGSTSGTTIARAYTKGTGYTWTAKTALTSALPAYGTVASESSASGWAAAWHAQGGTAGTIVAFATYSAATGDSGQTAYILLNCDSLIAGSGTLSRGSGDGATLLTEPSATELVRYRNATGTGVDITAVPGAADRGHIVAYNRGALLGAAGDISQTRYTLNSGGTGFSSTAQRNSTPQGVRDADSKVRVIPKSATEYIVVAISSASGVGPRITVVSTTGSSTSSTVAGSAVLAGQGIASLPSASTLAVTAAWDASYDPTTNKVWFYYFDTANGRRLMRTGVDLNTYLPDGFEVQISAAVGASGSTNRAIRLHRGALAGSMGLISVANRTSGGTHSTIYLEDAFALAPTQPVLATRANFDADNAATFSWTFTDPNPGDTQSAYQLEIVEVGVGTVFDSTKTTSTVASRVLAGGTLTNGEDFQWRVRTWDSADLVGPYSSYATFSTANAGTVTVVDPAADNPAGVNTSFYLIGWSVSGATQNDYRVRVEESTSGTLLVDTGWVTSAATTYLVEDMLSDVEYEIQVTVRSSGVESSTGTRLLTPSFAIPVQPTITVTAEAGEAYILVEVVNPPPSGSTPQVTHNDIMRRVTGSGDPLVKVGQTTENGSYRDYTAASGATYDYVARGQSPL